MGTKLNVNQNNVIANLDATDKANAISQIVGHVAQHVSLDQAALTKALMFRETKKSSGHGKQVALLHLINSVVPERIICFATLKNPVPWDAIDGKPVRLVAAVLVPTRFISDYLETVHEIAVMLSDGVVRASMLNMQTPAQIMAVLNSAKRNEQ